LQKQVEQVNNGHMLKSFFSISVGIRCFEPSQDVNVENLIARAGM
jgi:hypothetical protein